MRVSHKNFIYLFLVILLSFFAIKALFVPQYFSMHDDVQPSRIYEMANSLSFGQFPVRIVNDLGYGFGYPIFNFYSPLPYYLGAIFYLLGFSILTSTKIMFIVGILLSGIFMYYFVKEFASFTSALVSSLLYVYAPYHAVNIYVRGAVGEYFAYAFLPLAGLGLVKIYKYFHFNKDKSKKSLTSGIVLGSLGIFAVFLSHNILSLITIYFLTLLVLLLFVYFVIKKKKLFYIYYFLFTVLLGFGLSSFFTLPAFFEKNYTKVEELTTGTNNFSEHFLYIDQLWNSPWGFAGSSEGRADGMSFKIGKVHLLLGLLGIFVLFTYWLRKKKKAYFWEKIIKKFIIFADLAKKINFPIYSFLILVFVISIFFMLQPSKFVWRLLPGFPFIQYPWRFLNFSIFSLSVLASVIFLLLPKRAKVFVGFTSIILILWFNAKYFAVQENLVFNPQDYIGKNNLIFKISRISDEYLPKDFPSPKSYEELEALRTLPNSLDAKVEKIKDWPTVKEYKLNFSKPNTFLTNVSAFPGWHAFLDNKKIHSFEKNGIIRVEIGAGEHILVLKFVNTPIRTVGNTISILSLFLLVYTYLIPVSSLIKQRLRIR